MGLIVGFSLHQFSEVVLKIRDAQGDPYVIIGGQAVNYWAERYLTAEPELEFLKPFTSQDIDFKGGLEDVRHIAEQLKLTAKYPHKVVMTALAGAIPFQIGKLESNIEIVRWIPGISNSAAIPAIKAQWQGKTIRVLDPISLLASKIQLAVSVSQKDRQDVEHVKILIPCVRAFLTELLQQVENNEIPSRHWLGTVNKALNVTTHQRARKLAKRHKIDWSKILPLEAIAQCKQEKIKRFREQQLGRRDLQ